MRTIGGGNSAQPSSPAWTVEVEDHLGALQNLTSDAVSVEYEDPRDERVVTATVVFRRRSGASSLAPLMTANPPIDVGRDLVVKIDPGSGTFKEVFRGRIDKVDTPDRYGDVTVLCSDQAGVIADTWIETAIPYSTEVGVDLEDVAQSLANDNLTSPPTIYVPVATSALVIHSPGEAPYGPSGESVLSAITSLADGIGWVIRWRHFDASVTDWKWTLFEPERAKTTPDHTFGTSDYYDVSVMSQDITDIRNAIKVEYTDGNGARRSVTVTDSASITKYGRRYMKISEKTGSGVNNSTLASALANAALSDLKEPDAILEITAPFFWPGEIGVDLYRFTANNVHFSSDQDLAPVSISHRLAVGERAESKILCRGAPSGGVLMWRGRDRRGSTEIAEADSVYGFNQFGELASTTTTVTLGDPAVGVKVAEVRIWINDATIPFSVEPWDDTTTVADATLSRATFVANGYEFGRPTDNTVRFIQNVTVDADGNLRAEQRWRLYPTAPPPEITRVAQTSSGSVRYVDVIGNSGTKSLKLEYSTWSHHVDGRAYQFTPTSADPDGTSGIGAAVWPMTLTAYSLSIADLAAGGTPTTDVETVTVTGPGASAEPVWDAPYPRLTAPSDGSAIMTLQLKASGAGLPGSYTTKVYARRQTGGGWTSYVDITASTSPDLTGDTPPTSTTSYTYTGAYVRDDAGLRTVTYQIKADILNGSAVVVGSSVASASWSY